jgi:hypothetical protein
MFELVSQNQIWRCRSRRLTGNDGSSSLDSDAFPKNAIRSDPTIHQSPVVSDLEASTIDRFDEVQIFIPAYLAEDNVSKCEC